MDNALDQHPGLTIVMGGDTNHLDVNELCQLTGWNSLVDFPTRGVAYLDNVLTNRPDLFGKCAPFSISIKTDHTAVILPAGSKLKPVRQKVRIRDCRKHRKEALYLELAGETWDSVLETNHYQKSRTFCAGGKLTSFCAAHALECVTRWRTERAENENRETTKHIHGVYT